LGPGEFGASVSADVCMTQGGQNLRFAFEPREALRIEEEGFGQD